MICDICKKNQATVHLTEIIDDKITELHICEDCAKHKGAQIDQQFEFSDLLAGLAEFGDLALEEDLEPLAGNVCSQCGMTYEQFKKHGRFGCPHCYTDFKQHIIPLLKRIQGATQHLGKVPQKTAQETKVMEEIKQLKMQLERAIAHEDFEEAAKLRDKIKQIADNAK